MDVASCEQRAVLRVDEHGKNIVWERGDYFVAVDNPQDASYVTLWHRGRRVGALQLGRGRSSDTRGYATVRIVAVEPAHRNRGLGTQMYRAALAFAAPHYRGIGGEQEQRSNRRQVPAIYRRLGGRITPAGDYLLDRPHESDAQVDVAAPRPSSTWARERGA